MNIERKNILSVIWLILIVLAVEIFICNYSTWKSLFYTDSIVFEQMQVSGGKRTAKDKEFIVNNSSFSIHIKDVDMKIHNLFFSVDLSGNEVVPYSISLIDEGNHYFYKLPEQYIVPGLKRSLYTNLYPSGNVENISVKFTVPEGSVVRINEICANVRIPFTFNVVRFLVMAAAVLIVTMTKQLVLKEWNIKKQRIITAVVILLLIGAAWKLSHVNPICITSPWPHHKQYQELAVAMAKGNVFLDKKPSAELLQVENPYDTIYLQANDIDYHADYAFYEGKYYVYFGVVPELLLYLPCYLLTGHHMPNYMAVFIFYSGFIVAVFALYHEVIKRWFQGTTYVIYLVISTLTVLCSNYLFVIARPDLYDTPIIAATMFTVAGLWLWIKGKYSLGMWKRIYFLLGSLSFALVAGCRPQMLLFSFLAVPLFWEEVIKKRELFSGKAIWDTVCIVSPYLFVSALIMYYNAARFGSPFDFGATYSLTSNDMTKRSFNLPQTFLGIWHYFLQPPILTSDFPFLQGNQIKSHSYIGKLNSEYTYGGILACNVFTWGVLLIGRAKANLKKKGVFGFVILSILVSVILAVVDVTGAGILQRYMVDMVWGLWFAASIVILQMIEQSLGTKQFKVVVNLLLLVAFLQLAYGLGVVLGNGDLSVNVRTTNPTLYYKLQYLFKF